MAKRLATHCKVCSILLDSSNSVYNAGTGVRAAKCRTCLNEYHRKYREERFKDPEIRDKYNEWKRNWMKENSDQVEKNKEGNRDRWYKREYGITEEEYFQIAERQQWGCAICRQICKTHDRLSVDHDHVTGEFRGLLCQKCNSAIAMLNEDENLFWKAMEYLKEHKWSKSA